MLPEIKKRDLSAAIETRAYELLKLLEAQSPLSVPQYEPAHALVAFNRATKEAKQNA